MVTRASVLQSQGSVDDEAHQVALKFQPRRLHLTRKSENGFFKSRSQNV